MEDVKFSFEFKQPSVHVFLKGKKYPITAEELEQISESMTLEYSRSHAPIISDPWWGEQSSETIKVAYLGNLKVMDVIDISDSEKVIQFHLENLISSEYPETRKLIDLIAEKTI